MLRFAILVPFVGIILANSPGCTLSMGVGEQNRNAVARENAASTSSTLKRLAEVDDPQVRSLVAREIGQLGPSARDAIPALHRLIDDPDRHVRLEAAKALLAIEPGEPVAIPSLVMIINDPQTSLEDRIVALNLLQNSGPKGQAALALHNASTNTSNISYPTTRPARTVRIEESSYNQYRRSTPQPEPIRASDISTEPTPPPAEPPVDAVPEPRTQSNPDPEPIASVTASRTLVAAAVGPVATTAVVPAPPATRPAAADIPGLTGLTSLHTAPAPDIQLYGLHSYSSTQASAVRNWLERQTGLTDAECEARIRDFHRWRTAQDRLIYQRALEK